MITDDISASLQEYEMDETVELVKKALAEGNSAKNILENGLLAGMAVIGEAFKKGEAFVPEVLVAAMTMNECAEILKPTIAAEGVQAKGKVVIGTVRGDLHDIGKNLVKMMMEGYGLTVVDIGIDVPDEKFVETVRQEKPDVLALSALLTTTMSAQGDVIAELGRAGLRGSVKVMVGGAPITQGFADSIGADAYTPDAASAAEKAVAFCAK